MKESGKTKYNMAYRKTATVRFMFIRHISFKHSYSGYKLLNYKSIIKAPFPYMAFILIAIYTKHEYSLFLFFIPVMSFVS